MAMARYSSAQLRMEVRRIMLDFAAEARSNPETFDLVSPPSGRRAGVDAYTEVGGFSADAETHVVTPLLNAFPGGATQPELAEYLKALPDTFQTRAESAGPYMVEATQRLMAKLAPDVLAAAEPPKHEVPTDEFVAAMAGYSHEEGFYHHRLLEQAVKAIGQPDTLTERNMPELLSRFEALSSDQIKDPDGMDYFWEDVTDKLNGTFKALDEQRKAAATAGPAADAADPAPEVAPRKL